MNVRASGASSFSNAPRSSCGVDTGVPSHISPRVSRGTPFSRMRHFPMTSKLSRASPSGSMNRWHALQVGFVR